MLSGIQLAALGPLLKPSDQLRYRIGSVLPGYPTASAAPPFPPARLPTMLWPAWSLRLAIPHCHQWQLRPALSAVLLLVNSRFTLDEATRLIGSPLEGQDISRVLRLLEKHDQWHNIRAALIGMAAYLADNDIPIDYQRRRRTDYTTLLPDAVWAQICRDTATPGPGAARARIARCFLFERLSGLPAATAPGALDDSAFRTKTADFPRYLTPLSPTHSRTTPRSSSPSGESRANPRHGSPPRGSSRNSSFPVPTLPPSRCPNSTDSSG